MAPSANPLIEFYKGTASDHRGRYLTEILGWSDEDLEYKHDYIQTVFPLPEQSGVNWSAPVVDECVFKAFRENDVLRRNFHKAFLRIISFYGLKIKKKGGGFQILVGPNYPKQANNWVRRFDHNHLRITRIIRSLRVLGLEEEAQVFFQACLTIAKSSGVRGPSERSQMYWERAAMRPLNIAPDVKDQYVSEDMGPVFLREYEESKRTTVATLKGEETDKSEFPEGQDIFKRDDTASPRDTPAASDTGSLKSGDTASLPNIAARSKETSPEEPVVGKKQSRLDFFFKNKGKKTPVDSPGDENFGDDTNKDHVSNSKTPTCGEIHKSLEGDDKGVTKDTAQEPALEPSQDDSKYTVSNSPIAGQHRPSLKRKSKEEP